MSTNHLPYDVPGREQPVTLANWQDPPGNRWSFQHVRELIPTAVIRHDPTNTWQLARRERDLSEVTFESWGRKWTVKTFLDETETDGFLVIHRGRIATELYFNDMEQDTTHLLQSVSKSITAAVVGCLVGRGALDPLALVEDVIPELRGTSFEGARIQQLLDMQTGTRFNEDYNDLDADVRVFEQVYLWRPRSDPSLPADATEYFATLTNDQAHGEAFRYRSVLTDVMSWVIERTGHGRFHDVVARELWGPMGAEHDAEVTVDATGNAMADGGLCTTLRDLGRVGLLYLNGGQRDGRVVVPPAWVEDTLTSSPESREAFARGAKVAALSPGGHYRNYWWVYDPAAPLLYAAGIYGQNVFVHGPTQTVVAKLSTWPTPLDEEKLAATCEATLAIGAYLEDEERDA